MIYELRTYTLQPGTQATFVTHVAEVGMKVRGEKLGKLEGYWTSEIGVLNQVVHLWSFASLEERTRLLNELGRIESWTRDYLPKARSMMLVQETAILSAVAPLSPPDGGPNIYELRRYTTHPGKAQDWWSLLSEALPARRKLSPIVGVWLSELGPLNQAVHLWSYRDLAERTAVRTKSMTDPQWKEFVGKVPPLLVRMESTILMPTPFSPLK